MKLVKWTAIIHTLFAIFIAILFFGCAKTIMVNPTKTSFEFERDKYDCHMQAVGYASDMGMKGNPFIIRDEMQRCLEIMHGWRVQR